MTDPGEQVRLARAYLDGGDPLQAVDLEARRDGRTT